MSLFNCFKSLFLLLLALFVSCAPAFAVDGRTGEGAKGEKSQAWLLKNIRKEHPRVFISQDNLEAIRSRALRAENEAFVQMKAGLEPLLEGEIVFQDIDIRDGTQSKDHEYGFRAAEAALVYLVTGDKAYLELSKKLLTELGAYYTARNKAGLNIHWFIYSQISALAAFDWIYADLTPEERTELGQVLLAAFNDSIFDGNRKKRFRENTGDYKTGFYGTPALAWYAGLVFAGEGIDDALAEQLLLNGYENHMNLLKYRKMTAGDAGGAASGTLGYSMGAYPWAELNFFHTFQSATGYDLTADWDFTPNFLYYVYWNWLPGKVQFGSGDENHFSNTLLLRHMYAHLSQIVHFYGSRVDGLDQLAGWMLAQMNRPNQDSLPFIHFLLTNFDEQDVLKKGREAGLEPIDDLPSAVFFDTLGQISMRSGNGPDDTYALFTSGGLLSNHRHYDNNNFIIFRNGFRALDSGTRPEPGQHLSHYYPRTIAHNCILIHMPGEVMPRYWGGIAASETSLPVPNDGGQRDRMGSEVVAYSQSKDYVYIASDATDSYHPGKAQKVLRQFVFIQPDVFVIFDKVVSTEKEYKKTWLLHTAAEIVISGSDEFYETSQGGKLFGRVILPENATLELIGGEGKQFWSDGRNWPLPVLTPEDWNYRRSSFPPDTNPLYGQWRIEVSPANAARDDVFLTLLQVGDDSLDSMIASERISNEDIVGVRFNYNGRLYEVLFNRGDEVGGSISIRVGSDIIVNESFTNTVEKQTGLFQ